MRKRGVGDWLRLTNEGPSPETVEKLLALAHQTRVELDSAA